MQLVVRVLFRDDLTECCSHMVFICLLVQNQGQLGVNIRQILFSIFTVGKKLSRSIFHVHKHRDST